MLIDNSRVLVIKQRYAQGGYAPGPWHFHPQAAVIVYFRGDYTSQPYGGWGPYRVRRGDTDVVPANTLHALSNLGSDPLELVVIVPK